MTQRDRYHPYGEPRDTLQVTATEYGYTGQRADQSTGLMYYQARYYDPTLRRFTQPDTIIPNPHNPQDLNRYTYTRNNPVLYTDPDGHSIDLPSECPDGWANGVCTDPPFAAEGYEEPTSVSQDLRLDEVAAKVAIHALDPEAEMDRLMGQAKRVCRDDVLGCLDGLGFAPSNPEFWAYRAAALRYLIGIEEGWLKNYRLVGAATVPAFSMTVCGVVCVGWRMLPDGNVDLGFGAGFALGVNMSIGAPVEDRFVDTLHVAVPGFRRTCQSPTQGALTCTPDYGYGPRPHTLYGVYIMRWDMDEGKRR